MSRFTARSRKIFQAISPRINVPFGAHEWSPLRPFVFPNLELFSTSALGEDREPSSPMPVGEPSPPESPTCRSLQSKPETAISGELRSFAGSRLALPIARREPQVEIQRKIVVHLILQ